MRIPTLARPATSSDLHTELEELRSQLVQAEQAATASRKTAHDQAADAIREQVQAKESELAIIGELESRAADEQRHTQALAALQEIENDCQNAKAQLDALRTEQGTLAKRVFDAEFRHSQMLRVRAEARKQLGL
jgi:hypothetical protein